MVLFTMIDGWLILAITIIIIIIQQISFCLYNFYLIIILVILTFILSLTVLSKHYLTLLFNLILHSLILIHQFSTFLYIKLWIFHQFLPRPFNTAYDNTTDAQTKHPGNNYNNDKRVHYHVKLFANIHPTRFYLTRLNTSEVILTVLRGVHGIRVD